MSTQFASLEIMSNETSRLMNGNESKRGNMSKQHKVAVVMMTVLVAVGLIALSSWNGARPAVGEKELIVSSTSDVGYYRKCTPGTYPSGRGCKKCPMGHYCTGEAKVACPGNEYQDCEGQSTCVVIPCGHEGVGSSYPGGFTSIAACAKGSYRAQGMKKCELVPAGSYGNEQGLCQPILCYEGFYQPAKGQLDCKTAPCGAYVNKKGAKRFEKCGKKMYQPNEESQTCLRIPTNNIPVLEKGRRCDVKRCSDGYWWDASGTEYKCRQARCGEYVPKGGSKAERCLPGYYQSELAQTACLRVPKGEQIKLAYGRRCGTEPCPVGYYQNEAGLDKCKPCRPGQYANKRGMKNCELCACGEFAKMIGSKKCSACGVGLYQESQGQSRCDPIPFGWEVDSSSYNGRRCLVNPCQPGNYRGKSEKKLDKCTPCAKGTAVHHEGAYKCEKCKCGRYQDRMGRTTCLMCAKGFYQPVEGMTACIKVLPTQKVHPNKCKLLSYYGKNPPPPPPPAPVTCKPFTGGNYPNIKKGTIVSVGNSNMCQLKCKSSPSCLCYGFEIATKKCYLGSGGVACKFVVGAYPQMKYGTCTRLK